MELCESNINFFFSLNRKKGKGWYNSAHKAAKSLSRKYKIPLYKISGVISALSPRNKWLTNVKDTETLLEAYMNKQALEDFKVSTFNRNKEKAWKLLSLNSEQEVEALLNGKKTQNFFWNIYQPKNPHHVTLDTHMYGVVHNERVISKSFTNKKYEEVKQHFIEFALARNLTPNVVQAICWNNYRTFYSIK